jgi:hypothetical protein
MGRATKVGRREFIERAGVAAALGIGALSTVVPAFAAQTEDLSAIARDAYIWGFPLVKTHLYRDVIREKRVPINRFVGKSNLAKPSDRAVGPNNDTLYGYSWIDLSKEPQLLGVPDTNDRYYSIQFIDAYANSYAYVGRRTTGTKKAIFAIVGPDWKGTLPAGLQTIHAPTSIGLAFTRTLVSGDADLPAARAVHHQYVLATLSSYPELEPPAQLPDADLSIFSTAKPAQLGVEYFDNLSAELAASPAPQSDRETVELFGKIGIGPSRKPTQQQDPAAVHALRDAIPAAAAEIAKANFSTNVNGWFVNYEVTNVIKNPLLRAPVNFHGVATHVAEEALYFGTSPLGQTISGTKKFVLRFPKGQLPPVDAFWSLALYGADLSLFENPINRYSIGDRTAGLVFGRDGSLEIRIQADQPAAGTSNWLPAPRGPFQLILRAYQPRLPLLDRSYKVPALQEV